MTPLEFERGMLDNNLIILDIDLQNKYSLYPFRKYFYSISEKALHFSISVTNKIFMCLRHATHH